MIRQLAFAHLVAFTLAVTSQGAKAGAMYRVDDLGVGSAGVLNNGGDQFGDVLIQNRLSFDPSGAVTSSRWGMPGYYTDPLPNDLGNGAYGRSAIAVDRHGNNLAGWGFAADRSWTGFVSLGGHVMDVGKLPTGGPNEVDYSQAFGVNSAGQVVGMSNNTALMFTTDHGIQPIASPGFASSAAYAINATGEIVGEMTKAAHTGGQPQPNSATDRNAFVSDNGKAAIDLNTRISPTSGFHLFNANGINDAGQIAAFGTDASGLTHLLKLTPISDIDLGPTLGNPAPVGDLPPLVQPIRIPEPLTWITLAVGIGLFGVQSRWKRLRRSE